MTSDATVVYAGDYARVRKVLTAEGAPAWNVERPLNGSIFLRYPLGRRHHAIAAAQEIEQLRGDFAQARMNLQRGRLMP
ncbi:MAG: hypothetical protein KGK07_06450 [Chloroflexota bacterium]|nr:hypothetical protein [Chloroflexota bacterium]MDE3095625.1 hypothetical protein [Chloroflexota bacterium]